MSPEKAEILHGRYPFLQPCWGFECSDGWFDLLDSLCLAIKNLRPPDDFVVDQVKEKFGGLRFYSTASPQGVYDLIDKAERESKTICEQCGELGKTRDINGWFKTLCQGCV